MPGKRALHKKDRKHKVKRLFAVPEDKTDDIDIFDEKKPTPQREIMSYWYRHYKQLTGEEFKSSTKDYVIISRLIKKSGLDKVKEKAELLFNFCKARNTYFTKRGGVSFTLAMLSSHWNEIAEDKKLSSMAGGVRG
jgi:hypothetical protein